VVCVPSFSVASQPTAGVGARIPTKATGTEGPAPRGFYIGVKGARWSITVRNGDRLSLANASEAVAAAWLVFECMLEWQAT